MLGINLNQASNMVPIYDIFMETMLETNKRIKISPRPVCDKRQS